MTIAEVNGESFLLGVVVGVVCVVIGWCIRIYSEPSLPMLPPVTLPSQWTLTTTKDSKPQVWKPAKTRRRKP